MEKKSKIYLNNMNLRKQYVNEIIIDIDDRLEHGFKAYTDTLIALIEEGYHVEVWYAKGMKEPHIHIKNVIGLADLDLKKGTEYRKLFFEKFIPKKYWRKGKLNKDQGAIPDYSIANSYEDAYHPIAEENLPHYKYETIKEKVAEFNKDKKNLLDLDIQIKVNEPKDYGVSASSKSKVTGTAVSNKQTTLEGAYLYQKVASKLSIIYLADCYGLKPLGTKKRWCPFHVGESVSLDLTDEGEYSGTFNCHSNNCQLHGNIVLFYAMLRKQFPDVAIDFKGVKQYG